jgi:hypothetical protein
MAVSRDEMLADLKKVRIRRYVYFGAAIVLALLAIALVVAYFVRLPGHDIAAIILATVAVIFGAIMVNQGLRTRKLEALISLRLAESDSGPWEGAPAEAEPEEEDAPSTGEGSDRNES